RPAPARPRARTRPAPPAPGPARPSRAGAHRRRDSRRRWRGRGAAAVGDRGASPGGSDVAAVVPGRAPPRGGARVRRPGPGRARAPTVSTGAMADLPDRSIGRLPIVAGDERLAKPGRGLEQDRLDRRHERPTAQVLRPGGRLVAAFDVVAG